MRSFLQLWLVTAAGVMVASQLVGGISYSSVAGLLTASLLLGVVRAFCWPVTRIFSVLTLGMFALVFNAILLWLVGLVVKSFDVAGFWAAFWGGVVISFVSMILNWLIPKPAQRPEDSAPPPSRPSPPPGAGPIIDV